MFETIEYFLSARREWVCANKLTDDAEIIRMFGQQALHTFFIRFQTQRPKRGTAVVNHVSVITQDVAKSGLLNPLTKIILFAVTTTISGFVNIAYLMDRTL
jgi:hypothetical protein